MKIKSTLLNIVFLLIVIGLNAQNKVVNIDDKTTAVEGRKVTHLSSKNHKFKSKEAGNLNSLAIEFAQKNKLKQAKENFLKSLKLEGDHAALYNNLGLVEMLSKNYVQAEKYCYKSLEVDPEYLDPYLNLVVIFNFNKEYERGIKMGEFILPYLNNDIDKATTHLNMASSFFGLEQYVKTKEEVDKAKGLIGDKVYEIKMDLKKQEKKLDNLLKAKRN